VNPDKVLLWEFGFDAGNGLAGYHSIFFKVYFNIIARALDKMDFAKIDLNHFSVGTNENILLLFQNNPFKLSAAGIIISFLGVRFTIIDFSPPVGGSK